MNRVSTAFVAAVLAALAWAAPAMSADTPTLQLYQSRTALNGPADAEIDFSVPSTSPATAKLVLYAPTGYKAQLGQAPGARIADAAATVSAGGTPLQLQGQVVADAPANYAADARAQACAPGTHAAVWVIQLPTATRTLSIPVFVDPTSGAEVVFGAYKLQVCFASPYVSEAQGGAPFGASVLDADLNFDVSVFRNPATADVYVWRAFVTPYTAGTANPNVPATYELRTDAFIPASLKLKAKWDRRKKTGVISGTIRLAVGRPSSVSVRIIGGPALNLSTFKLLGSAKVKNGSFALRKKLSRTTYILAFLPAFAFNCDPRLGSAAPGGCLLETTMPVISNPVKLVVPKRR